MRVEKKSKKRRSASREGVRVNKECKLRRSETREGVRVERKASRGGVLEEKQCE